MFEWSFQKLKVSSITKSFNCICFIKNVKPLISWLYVGLFDGIQLIYSHGINWTFQLLKSHIPNNKEEEGRRKSMEISHVWFWHLLEFFFHVETSKQ
jgi:hypothetical protein